MKLRATSSFWPVGLAVLAACVVVVSRASLADDDPKRSDPAAAAEFHHGEWPFNSPVRPATPTVLNTSWCANAIDRFVLARLEKAGLHPNSEADKATLLRRVTFDLTGLPPTPAEVDAFLADRSNEAYSKVVDRLLASPRFGEQAAQHWLDVVRYADT